MGGDDQTVTISNECALVPLHIPKIDDDAIWTQEGVTVAGGKRWGTDLGRLNFPSGIFVDDDETLYIADYSNNRIMEWKKGATQGEIVAGEYTDGIERLRHPKELIYDKASDSFIISDEGNRRVVRWPRRNGTKAQTLISDIDAAGLAVDHEGNLYVCIPDRHEVRRWTLGKDWKVEDPAGTLVAGGNGKGLRVNQLNQPTCVFVDKDQSVFVSDWANHRVMKWVKGATKGIMVCGSQYNRIEVMELSDPFGLIIDHLGNLYVADWLKHRVMRWAKGAEHGDVVVGDGVNGSEVTQFSHPMGIAFDKHGNLYVSDHSNHRVQKFNIRSDYSG